MKNKKLCCSICGTTEKLAIVEKDIIIYCGICYLNNIIYPKIKNNNDIKSMTIGYKNWSKKKYEKD
jgi:hypothetical protein